MNRAELSRERSKVINQSQRDLDKQIRDSQRSLYRELTTLISELSVEGSVIKFTAGNMAKARKVGSIFTSEGIVRRLVGDIIRNTRSIFGLNRRYFDVVVPRHDKNIDRRVEQRILRSLGYNPTDRSLDKDGFFADLNDQNVRSRVIRQINAAVASNQDIDAFKEQFRTSFLGRKNRSGVLERHYKERIPSNVYAGIDRNNQSGTAKGLGLGYAIWQHTIKNTSTDFCIMRSGRLYTIETINSWNDLPDWEGRIPGADVKQVGHGYGCRSRLNYISNDLAQILIKQGREVDTFNETVVIG